MGEIAMDTERVILDKIWEMRKKTKSAKFVGAITVELLRKELVKQGLNVSNRDVFIEGVPNELDLVIAKARVEPEERLVYRSDDVLAVLEIKFRGVFRESAIETIKGVFDTIIKTNDEIRCYYVNLSEKETYPHRVTREKLGYDCFELLTRKSSDLERVLKRNTIHSTGEWDRLLRKLRLLGGGLKHNEKMSRYL